MLGRVTRLTARLTKLEEGAEDDADDLEEPTDNKQVQRVRKAELLALRAEVEQKNALLEEWMAKVDEKEKEIVRLNEEIARLQRELAGEQRVTAGLTEERDALQIKVKKLQQESAAAQADLKKAGGDFEALTAEKAASDELAKQFSYKYTETNLKLETVEKDSAKLRARLESKEELAKNASADNATLQLKMEELLAEGGRKDRALTNARQQALEEKQKGLEFEQAAQWLREDKQRLEAVLERKVADGSALMDRATKAEATAKMLQSRLDALGAKTGEASLEMRPLAEVQKQAGVFDPLGQLPNVPVLSKLVDTIDSAQTDLAKLQGTDGHLSQMAKVEVLQVDQTIPPDEGEFKALGDASAGEIPLPYPPVLMRQFTPPPENLPPPSPPPPEEEGASVVGSTFAKEPVQSGAGSMMLPDKT